MSKEITNKLYRPLSIYFHPSKDSELEVVSKTHGKFIATSKYTPGNWGDFVCWIDVKTGEEVPADKETDLYREHEPRFWKYIDESSFKTAPSWFHFMWGVWRIIKKDDGSLSIKNIDCTKELCVVKKGDTLYLGDEVDKWGNLYPAPYVKSKVSLIKTVEFPDEANKLLIGEVCLYKKQDNTKDKTEYLYMCRCVDINEKTGIVTLENISNYKRYNLKPDEHVLIVNSGIKLL